MNVKIKKVIKAHITTAARKREKFSPFLENVFTNERLGVIGTKTKLIDKNGNKLYVGDVVGMIDGGYFKSGVVCSDGKRDFILGFPQQYEEREICKAKGYGYDDIEDRWVFKSGILEVRYIKSPIIS